MITEPLIEMINVGKTYLSGQSTFKALNDVSLQIYPSEILGVVGESGSGKSTLAKLMIGLEKPSHGNIFFQGQNFLSFTKRDLFNYRKFAQMIFQNPQGALNPRMTLEQILNEPLDIHKACFRTKRLKRIHKLLDLVGLGKNHLSRYPHQLSGGQCQRACIARALALEPKLLICDEPLSSLDLSIQSQIIQLLRTCQTELGIAMLFISHDFAAVDFLADRVLVMSGGMILEHGKCEEVFLNPQHPYTQNLLNSAELFFIH